MNKTIDFLEKEFGIKENQIYNIYFKSEQMIGVVHHARGEILNFCPTQIVLKSDEGLYIVCPRNIVEMRPIKKL